MVMAGRGRQNYMHVFCTYAWARFGFDVGGAGPRGYSYLALLPLSIHKEIITLAPIADVCRLEETPFVDGLDLKPYWRSCLSPMRLFYRQQQHLCLDLQRICEDKWGPVEFAKASFYSEVAENI